MLGFLQIGLNARVLGVALCLEVLVVTIFDIGVIGSPGPQGLTGVGWHPGVATPSALGAALTFSVASFVGFESAAIYSEECRDPKRTVARATVIAGMCLVAMLVLGVANFNVLITSSTTAPTDTMAIVLPVILFGSGVVGLLVAWYLRAARPRIYAGIGERTATEVSEQIT